MAAETGIPSVYLEHQLSHGRATKKTQGTLIERLRSKNAQNHSWTDSIKSVRSFVAERRTQIENTEPSGVQQCLDTLQKAMKVKSQQTLKERLDLIGRHLGLNTQIHDQKVSLGTDTFQVDVLLGDGGIITNVKLANQGDVVDCPDLKDILKKGDFSEFIEHLQGLQSIYQVTSDEKLKSKAFLALQALEKDLNQLAQFQSSISGVANYIHKCPLGIMLPRLAGKPMKLIYFVSPYDLLDKKSLAAHPLTVEAITENFLGQSVTVCIEPVHESAPANKLQTMPLMNVNKTQDGKSLPSFSAVSKINSMMLPASFVLILPQSIPVSIQILQKITAQTNLEIHKEADTRSLRSLILEAFSGGSIKDSRKLYVSLPDQQHVYYLDCLNGESQTHEGMMVSRIPFTHPTHVPQILNFMRQQLLFNIIIGSCVRPGAKTDVETNIVFEVTAISLQQLTIVFEHPAYDSMTRVDIDLSDITSLKCKVACANSDQVPCSDEAISRIFHRCMSIPVMLRWLVAKGRGHLDKLKEAALAAKRELLEKAMLLKELQQQQAKLQPTTLPTNRPPPQPPHPPPLPPPPSYSHRHSPVHLPHSNGQAPTMNPILSETRGVMINDFLHMTENNSKHINNRLIMSPDTEHVHNPLLTNLLDEEELSGIVSQKEVHDSPMLSRLLDDNTSVATTVIPMNCKPALMTKRQRKRRTPSDVSGPSPKHHIGDNDLTDRYGSFGSSIDLETGSSLMDHSSHNTPPAMRSATPTHASAGHHHHHPLLTRTANAARSQNNVIDLTEDSSIGESSLKKLADSMDKHFVHNDVKSEPDLSMLLNETEAYGRISNILHNSASGSKNENASTSLEVFLKGSGEVGRAKDFDPSDASSIHSSTTCSKLSSLLLGAPVDTPSPHLSLSPHKANSMFFNDNIGCDEPFGVGVGKPVTSSIFMQDMKVSPASVPKAVLYQSSSVEFNNDKKCITGIFEKFDISRQQKNAKIDSADCEVKAQPVEGKVSLRLRVGPLKQQNRVKPFVKPCKSVDETDLYSKPNSIRTFDFKSDEDDDDNPRLPLTADRYVYSSSPTRLQISSTKHKQLNDFSSVPQKSEKAKKKDRSSGNTTKRKREKYESKREKKRKKTEHFFQEAVYRTVENDTKADFKLKIRVAKKPLTDKSDVFSDGKGQSYEISKKPLVSSIEKLIANKEELKDTVSVVSDVTNDKDSSSVEINTHKNVSGKSSAHQNKSSPKSGSSRVTQSGSSSGKTDPKLVTKATIRLKPLTMPNSGSTVNIGQSGSKISSSVSGSNKTERRSSTSVTTPVLEKRSTSHSSLERKGSSSNLVDRRSSTQSSSSSALASSSTVTTVTTPTTTAPANLSLSSILPNVPTTSKIASLPRIPKLSSSSSSTSISRTSSLDPVSGSSPTSAGTKSNNSYTVGPAGRPNSATTSGSGGSRSSGGGTASFNYSIRPTTPGNGSTGNSWSNMNANRPGLAHRQTSPLVNSNPGGSQKLSGPRLHSPSVSGTNNKAGVHSANSHRHSGNFTNSMKESSGSSNSPQKSSGGVAKINNSIISSKMGNNFMGQKSNTSSSNIMSGQRHVNQNTYPGNSSQAGGSSSIVTKSPNTSGSTKSPNSGKSPNLMSSGRSPSLNSASKSPNISTVNKSPNISSSSAGRSPNLTPTRSPSINNNSVRSTPNTSSKSSASVSHKHLSSMNKSASVNKSIIKTSHSTTSQRSSKNISGSIKSFPAKSEHKTTSGSSNALQIVDSNLISVPAQHASPVSISGNTSSVKSSSNLSSTESTSPYLPQKSSASLQPQITPVSSPASTLPQLSILKASDFDKIEPNKTSTVSSMAAETSVLSTPSTPYSADGIKSKFNFSASKGRKNSLSAIVDKLKHNAVGAVLDSTELLSSFSEGQTSTNSKAYSGVEDLKSDDKSGIISSISSNQDERTTSSQLSSVEYLANSDSLHSRVNHVLECNQMKNSCKQNNESNVTSFSAVKSLHSDCSAKKGDVMSNENSCDKSKNIEHRPHDVAGRTEFKQGFDCTIFKESAEDSCSDNTNSRPNNNFSKEKQVPPKVHSLQQSLVSSAQESSASSSSTLVSPLAPVFQPLQSPSSIKNTSPVVIDTNRVSKGSKLLGDQPFKLPSAKPSGDHLDEESRSFEVLPYSLELRDSKLDNICSSTARDHFNQWPQDGKTAQPSDNRSSLKPPSSPLSDISSPENGLIIDDGESPRLSSRTPGKISGINSVAKPQSPKSLKGDATSSISQLPENKPSSIPNSLDCTLVSSSPKINQPSSAKSPTLAKNVSGASTPKDSDSPCPIDDDLMDMALGFGS